MKSVSVHKSSNNVTGQGTEKSGQLPEGSSSVPESAKEPSQDFLGPPISPDVLDLRKPGFRSRIPVPVVHPEVPGIQYPVMAGVRSAGSNLLPQKHPDIRKRNARKRNARERNDSVGSSSSRSAKKQKLSDLPERKKDFRKAIENTSGDSYVRVLRIYRNLFREGHATGGLPDNFKPEHLRAVAEILNGVPFKPIVRYTDREIINSLCALNDCESLLESFTVEVNFNTGYRLDDELVQIPPGTYTVDFSSVEFEEFIKDIPPLHRSVKELNLHNCNMAAGDLDFRQFVHVEILHLTGNNLTNDQVANVLQVSPSMKTVHINVFKEHTDEDESSDEDIDPDEAPDDVSLEKLQAKYPECKFLST